MIKVGSINDIEKQFIKNLGSGEESKVGLLKDKTHIAKIFHSPKFINEKDIILMGKDLDQSSFAFFKDIYSCNDIIYGAIADYVEGEDLSQKILSVPYIDILYSLIKLRKDIKTISDANILVSDIKPFNTKYTNYYITIVDTGRFTYSNMDKDKLYEHNLEMVYSLIRMTMKENIYFKQLLNHEEKLSESFKNNDTFPNFFSDLQKYTSEIVGNNINSFNEYLNHIK